MKTQFELNGRLVLAEHAPGSTLMEYLRDEEIYSVKHGCDHGECGACTVLIDGKAMNACIILVHAVDGRKVETLESFSTHESLHPLQHQFLKSGAAQCGYCTPGMILSLVALEREGQDIKEDQVRDALNGNLCRCTGYVKPVTAALAALQSPPKGGADS